MSKTLITQYYNRLDKLIQFGGTRKETSVRNEFYNLLSSYAEKRNLVLVAELPVRGTKGRDVTPDGTLKNVLRLEYGHWESKDESLKLDEEIDKKINKGYPLNNILFEDSEQAVLIQGGETVMRVNMKDPDQLDRILSAFVNHKNPLVKKFENAIDQFQSDIPTIIETLREKIGIARQDNPNFISVSETFLELCKAEINPDITMADVREMMIQHILTGDIFNKVFGDAEFHRHNNIANELEKLVGTLFDYSERRNLLGSIEHYYEAINTAAASVADHHEKQKFLKALYENFYKAYNPKAADRLGVVYTPNEIVDFMVDSTNFLLEKHFRRQLWDKNVEILDPATGTGTFICSIIDKCPKQYLVPKYKKELHANDVAILPYYVANLNIEYTFKQKMGYYEEFQNICFVDTLDNTFTVGKSSKQAPLYVMSYENSERIKRQNHKKISVVIGNPPYNANQKNENENNKNRDYPVIDNRVKLTFVKHSTAQKTKAYDMYARFYRWAMDRIDANGIIAFITNRSFIDSRTFDGFRKCVENDFAHCYIIDTQSDVRANPKIAGTTHNVFGIQTGVAVMFLVKSEKQKEPCRIEYTSLPDEWRKEEKWQWFSDNRIERLEFQRIFPDKNNNWINIPENDFEQLLGIIDNKSQSTLFNKFSNGISTNRDEWAYDINFQSLQRKIDFFTKSYNEAVSKKDPDDERIKWSRDLRVKLKRGRKIVRENIHTQVCNYRPFIKRFISLDSAIVDVIGINSTFFSGSNISICVDASEKDFRVLASNKFVDLHFVGDTKCIPFGWYDPKGEMITNITDWGLQQFTGHYQDESIGKEDIFHYVYAVLHNPAYRKKYELNLKREFPRIPFYKDFWQWAAWGKELMDLHIGYESVEPFPLKEHTYEVKAEAKRQKEMFSMVQEPEPMYGVKPKVKTKLKADKRSGIIEIDELTFLSGVPRKAWEYKLGNRSALEWILDQYKEKTPKDPTIAEKFNTYRFADYKEKVIDLLKRVCTVSLETVRIVNKLETAN